MSVFKSLLSGSSSLFWWESSRPVSGDRCWGRVSTWLTVFFFVFFFFFKHVPSPLLSAVFTCSPFVWKAPLCILFTWLVPSIRKSLLSTCLSIYLSMHLFIYGCIGSSLLCMGFLKLWRAGATLRCSAWVSHWGGLSCCGAQAPGAQAQ